VTLRQSWPWNFLVRRQQPFIAGLNRLGRIWVYTSRGTGYWGPPMRFGAPSGDHAPSPGRGIGDPLGPAPQARVNCSRSSALKSRLKWSTRSRTSSVSNYALRQSACTNPPGISDSEAPAGWVGLSEAARRLGLGKSHVAYLVKQGKLKAVRTKVGTRQCWRIDVSSATCGRQADLLDQMIAAPEEES